MDAKDRLRRYLEQRRELGESELVLDHLPLDELMAMLGARGGTAEGRLKGPTAETSGSAAMTPEAPFSAPLPPPPAPDARFDATTSTDWRGALRGAPETAPQTAPASAGLPSSSAQQGVTEISSLPSLPSLASRVHDCTRCALHETGSRAAPGAGPAQARVLCIGDAPGLFDDEEGLLRRGEAAELFTKILGAVQLARTDVFVTSLVKHRPPGAHDPLREPLPEEITACMPYLLRQIALVQPRVILALGRLAAQTLLQTTESISGLRGTVHSFQQRPLIVTYHPAALLRNESWKRPAWEDIKLLRRTLDASREAPRAETP